MVNIFSKLFGVSKPQHETPQTPTPPPETDSSKAEPTAQDDLNEANLTAFVDFVVRALVKHGDEVNVSSEIDEQGLLIRIRCHPEEVGRIIGKSGKTIRAIRSLVKGAAARQNQKASVIVMED